MSSSNATDNITPAAVFEETRVEGGATQGSEAAQIQSQLEKDPKAAAIREDVAHKLETQEPIKADEANAVMSTEHRAVGHRPRAGSIAAQAQSQAAKEEATYHMLTNFQNLEKATQEVQSKIADDTITAEDISRLSKLELRAHGRVEKDGPAAQALSALAHEKQQQSAATDETDTDTTAKASGSKDTAEGKENENVKEVTKEGEKASEEVKEAPKEDVEAPKEAKKDTVADDKAEKKDPVDDLPYVAPAA